jgi:hypothetical protein
MRFAACLRAIIFLVLTTAVTVLEHSSATAQASQPDTSQWKNHRSAEWGFNISVPLDWVQLNMPQMLNQRMSLRRKLNSDNTKALMCSVSANDEPEMAGMSQQQINELILRGPPSVQQAQTVFHPAGLQYQVKDTSLTRIMGLPAYLYELSRSGQSMDVNHVGREIMISMFIPGKTFVFSCGVWANNEKDVNELYAQWLPTLRGVFSTIVIEPRR